MAGMNVQRETPRQAATRTRASRGRSDGPRQTNCARAIRLPRKPAWLIGFGWRLSRCMDNEEQDICAFLEAMAGQFVSSREIARRASGKWRWQADPNWPGPALLRLIDSGLVKSDDAGRYALARRTKRTAPPRWISPQIRKILEESGKDFGQAADPNAPEDPPEQ
jgi:hypothetical protein